VRAIHGQCPAAIIAVRNVTAKARSPGAHLGGAEADRDHRENMIDPDKDVPRPRQTRSASRGGCARQLG